ncbi:DNA-binding protein [Acinetobacter wuhouensis]|uniref:DNA-binding protein n=1 Tax=Acinetobacter wuhouensis TaxID=1879050 RepID=A0A3G2T4M6_9GAMM|nr:DNA-binding protein [Acinetobacter wuhouensis]AYO54935.1 DNA-binding protein [Acinetobacter wuhouensis]
MNLKTPEQVKQEFINAGTIVSDWAAQRNFTPQEVYKVLNGQSKGNYGRAHEIAVALGLKENSKVTV